MFEYLLAYLMFGWFVTVLVDFYMDRYRPGVEMIYRRSILMWPVMLIALLALLVFWMLEHGLDD